MPPVCYPEEPGDVRRITPGGALNLCVLCHNCHGLGRIHSETYLGQLALLDNCRRLRIKQINDLIRIQIEHAIAHLTDYTHTNKPPYLLGSRSIEVFGPHIEPGLTFFDTGNESDRLVIVVPV